MTTAADLIDVTVSVADAGVSRAGFAVPLVLAQHPSVEPVLTFKASTYVSELNTLGVSATSPARLALDAVFKQRPRPKTAKLGKRSVADSQVLVLTPTVGAAGFVHGVTIGAPDGTEYKATFANDGTPTLAEACTGIAAAINATAVAMTAVASATTVTLTGDVAGVLHSVYGLTANITLTDTTTQSGIAADLDAVEAYDADWYGLVLASSAPSIIEAAADWIETRDKILIAQTHDMDVLSASTTDIASSIKSQAYNNTRIIYNARALSFAGGALLAQLLTFEPGQSAADAKTLAGVFADKLTASQSTRLQGKNGVAYETVQGRDMTVDSGAGLGRFLDITMIVHWVTARLQEGYVSAKLASPKIPYTDQGIGATMYGICRNVLSQGQSNGAIDTDPETFSIDVPLVSEQDPADRAARRFPGTQLGFRATGAVHSADVGVNISF